MYYYIVIIYDLKLYGKYWKEICFNYKEGGAIAVKFEIMDNRG